MVTMGRKMIIVFLAPLLFLACDQNRIFEGHIPVEGMTWSKEQQARFEFEVPDSSSHYNMYVNLRNTPNYPFSNIYFFIQMVAPDQQYFMDTLEGVLTDKNGVWTGEGTGNFWEHRIEYKKMVRFPLEGKYTITIAHGMRRDPLPEITDVGFRLEKAQLKPSGD